MNRKRDAGAGAPVLILLSDIKDQNLPQYTSIDSPKFLIGRSPESNLTLLQKFISRKHCTFNHDEDTNKWTIISHSRTAVSVQGKDLRANDSIVLECGDKIKISPLIVFEFKCSPDSRYKCCMDFKKPRMGSDDENEQENEEELEKDDEVEPIPAINTFNHFEASYPDDGYLDEDVPFYNNFDNADDDVFVPIDVDVNRDIEPIEPISNVNIDEPDVPVQLGNDPELPSTLPISQIPISSNFDFINNSSDSVTESFDKMDSEPVSSLSSDSLLHSDDNLDINTSISELENEIENYANRDTRLPGKKAEIQRKLKDKLNYRLEFIKKLSEFNSSCELYFADPSDDSSLNKSIQELTSFFQKRSEFNSRNIKSLNEKSDEILNRIISNMDGILMKKAQQATSFVCKFREATFNKERSDHFKNSRSFLADNKPQNSNTHHEEHDTLVREKNDLQTELEKFKEENKKYKENMSWQESRIKFLELKMKEKEKLEFELETSKEENESLEKQNADLKRELSNLEIMELEYKNILEMNKYREEDKRSKDALQRTITTLEDQLKALKDVNAQLVNDKCLTQNEIEKLQEKCKDLEEKVREKILVATSSVSACGSGSKPGEEYCCDMVKEVKASLIDLMEREFQCSICGELMIESTVTNCNHIFCSFCLQEWKKKQKKCPICRAALVKEVKALIIDNYITDLLKLINENLHTERMKVISDRTIKKTPVPATPQAKGRNVRRNSRQAAAIVDLS